MGPVVRVFLLSLVILSNLSCGTVIFVRKGDKINNQPPSYRESQDYFFFGLVGKNEIYADQVCRKNEIDQVTAEYSTGNVVATIFTLGIYSPRTVKVWCALN